MYDRSASMAVFVMDIRSVFVIVRNGFVAVKMRVLSRHRGIVHVVVVPVVVSVRVLVFQRWVGMPM
jgi:hypothetical protein